MSKSTELHEQQLSEKTINMHRAIMSLIEELEAIERALAAELPQALPAAATG